MARGEPWRGLLRLLAIHSQDDGNDYVIGTGVRMRVASSVHPDMMASAPSPSTPQVRLTTPTAHQNQIQGRKLSFPSLPIR